jgi:DNA-binding IclR family transcriptional regulator
MAAIDRGQSPEVLRDRNSVQSVERALDVLSTLGRAGCPVSPADLAVQCGLSQTGIYRLLRALEKGRAVQRTADGEFAVGALVFELSSRNDFLGWLRTQAAPVMLQVRQAFDGETVGLYVSSNAAEFHCIESMPSLMPIRHVEPLFEPVPIARGGTSLVMLANLLALHGAEYVVHFLRALPKAVALESVSDQLRRVEGVAADGFAVSEGQRVPGVVSISAPIGSLEQPIVGALTVSGPASRCSIDALRAKSQSLTQSAAQVALRCGT